MFSSELDDCLDFGRSRGSSEPITSPGSSMCAFSTLSAVVTLNKLCADVPILPERDETGTKGFYKPIVFPNDFWHLRSQYVEINTTTPTLPLEITFQPMTYWKFQLFATMTYSFAEAAKQQGATGGAEMDEIKRMLVETNPYFLGLTALVSILHVVCVHFSFRLSCLPPSLSRENPRTCA